MKRWVKFCAAVAVASIYEVGSKAWGAFHAVTASRGKPNPLAEDRMKECRQCPIFYAPLETCGTPLTTGDIRKMGCHCFMPVKVETDCNCWLWNRSDGFKGWPAKLNSFPLE